MGTGERSKPRRPWPPPQPIAREGKVAAYTTTVCVAVAGTAYAIAAAKATMCTGLCVVNQGFAGLIFLLDVIVTASAFAALRSVSRRPIRPDGDARWRVGLAVILVLGAAAAASRIPDFTCPDGYRLGIELCAAPSGARIAATSWVWLKDALSLGAVVVAVVLAMGRTRRMVPFTAALAAVVWLGGTGALLVTTLLR
jgi:hypothetical protein